MKLRLKNFRCYIEKEFDFGKDGLVLLSGPSGCGKTSILYAINFVLYGTGTKLVYFGKTSCSVFLEFEDMVITRTKRPNRLVLSQNGVEYEDASAQGIINEKFGMAFNIISYLQQNNVSSFILLSPLEKLSFLEKFAFHGVDLTKIKSKCNAIIKKRNEELISTTSQLEMALEHFKTLTKPVKVEFPVKGVNKESFSTSETVKLKNTKTLIKREEKTLLKLRQELNDLKIYNVQSENQRSSLQTAKASLGILNSEIIHIEYEGDEKLKEYEDQLLILFSKKELFVLQDRYVQDEKRLDTMKESEKQSYQKELEHTIQNLWKDYSLEELEETIENQKDIVKDADKLEKLKNILNTNKIDEKKLENDRKTLETSREKLSVLKDTLARLELQKETYECPNCHTSLKIQENELVSVDVEVEKESNIDDSIESIKKEIIPLTKLITKLEYSIPNDSNKLELYTEALSSISEIQEEYTDELPSKKEVEDNIESLKDYKKAQQELEKKKKRLEGCLKDRIFSTSLTTFKEQLTKQKEHIKALESTLRKNDTDLAINEEDLRNIIQTQKYNKEKISQSQKQNRILTQSISTLEDEIHALLENFLKEHEKLQDIDIISENVKEHEEELEKLQKNLIIHEDNIDKLDVYTKYKEELERYKEWYRKIKDLGVLEQEKRLKYSASTMLKEKILQAESIAIENIISSINTHSQEYLDIFFPVDPIVVRLLPFKTTKKKTVDGKKKPQINIEIDYKGNQCDTSSLSGGELSRVVLAYTLALSEIFNSPLILLDECTSSLDQDLTSIVMEGIKDNFNNKLVVIIAHQLVKGSFDREIEL